jgi:adenosylcobinamide-GDP ribazoletransferase
MRALSTQALHELRLAFVALQFLTRVPVPRWVGFEPAWLQACLRHFPLVGACVGGFAAAVLWTALALWPPAVAAALSVVATVWLTGAFHEDGLADTCDGLGGAVSRARALEIMKDSRIGSYGAAGLGLALVWGHAASRAAPVLLVWQLPYAGDPEHAKAKPLATQIGGPGVATALAWLVILATAMTLLQPGLWAALAVSAAAAALAAVWCARWLRRRLGGFTGDTLGATQQVTELAVLLAWLASRGTA